MFERPPFQALCSVEMFGIRQSLINEPEAVLARMSEAVDELGLSVMERGTYHFVPHGVTGIFVLGESHLVYSTWPEYNGYMTADLRVCSPQINLKRVPEVMIVQFEPELFGFQIHNGPNFSIARTRVPKSW